jgi:hypothetical protein
MQAKNRAFTALAAVWLFLAVLAWGAWPAAAVSFDTIDVPGSSSTYVMGINQVGQVSGIYYSPVDPADDFHGFIFDGIKFTTIDFPGASRTEVSGINDLGHFVGNYYDGTYHGFVYDGVHYQTISAPGAISTNVKGINNAGVIVGSFNDSQKTYGFVYDGATFTTLDVPGAFRTNAYGINNQGKIVGIYATTVGTTQYNHGFVYDGVTYTTIDIPGAVHTMARGINDAGIVAGTYVSDLGPPPIYHGFTFDGVSPTTVDVPGATSTSLYNINNKGRLVGSYDLSGRHGCVSNDSSPINLLDYFIPSPLSRWCRYSYLTPAGFPGFTLRFTPITSGTYAGKYRMGDWNTPEGELAVWRIVSWNQQVLYVYADSQIGELPSPASFSTVFPMNTATPNPLPNTPGLYWYFKPLGSLSVAAGTFHDVLAFIVLDSAYLPNSMNAILGLTVPYAVTCVTYYSRGIGEIKMMDVDAQTGNIWFSYQLQSTGASAGLPYLPLLLGEGQ